MTVAGGMTAIFVCFAFVGGVFTGYLYKNMGFRISRLQSNPTLEVSKIKRKPEVLER